LAVAEVGSDRAEGLYELGRAFTMEEAIQFAVEDKENDLDKTSRG
jgi:hypothetical protein